QARAMRDEDMFQFGALFTCLHRHGPPAPKVCSKCNHPKIRTIIIFARPGLVNAGTMDFSRNSFQPAYRRITRVGIACFCCDVLGFSVAFGNARAASPAARMMKKHVYLCGYDQPPTRGPGLSIPGALRQ